MKTRYGGCSISYSNSNLSIYLSRTKLQHLATDFTDLKDREKQWTQERKTLTEDNTQLTQQIQQLAEAQNRVGVEKQSLEGELSTACIESTALPHTHTHPTHTHTPHTHTPHTHNPPPPPHTHTEIIEELQTELVKADQEQRSCASRLNSAEGQLESLSMNHQQLSAEMEEKCARLKQVETQRNGVQERLKHMDAQVHILVLTHALIMTSSV